jgi:DNA ligase-1
VASFADLVETSGRVAGVSGRLAKVRELAIFLKSLTDTEIEIAVHYLSGDLRQGRIGIGSSTLRAAATRGATRTSTLSVAAVDEALTRIAAVRGSGSGAKRDESLRQLLAQATEREQAFLIRLLAADLRQGALEGVMIDAIAAAAELPAKQVRRAAMYSKSLGAVARAALLEGETGLGRFHLELFKPIAPMLAETAADVDDALAQITGEVAFEWKMDGARIQVHKVSDDVRIYTRGLNEISAAMPEIVAAVRRFGAGSLVLDGEAIAIDAAGRPHPFQTTMRRVGRRLKVDELATELPIQAYFFDCLFLDGKDLAGLSTRERYQALSASVPASMQMPRRVTSSHSEARAFYQDALTAGHEGVMAKSLEAPYEAGNRGASWLKIKRSHTLDLVVLGAEWGNGRRTGKLSNLHLGAIEPATGNYVMLGKTFKGLTDVMLEWQTEQFLRLETRREGHTVFIKPEIVVEIAFSDLQTSRRYPGGFALRLARVKRYRTDKRVEEADTMESIRKIFAGHGGALEDSAPT